MSNQRLPTSKHFTLEQLTQGVYACIHRQGGAAYSNAGIIDLGKHTLLVDTLNSLEAGRDLRQAAEMIFDRPVETIILTHPHSDHWIGASAFETSTTLLASQTTRQVCLEWGAEIMEEFQNPVVLEEWLREAEMQLQFEKDERVRVGIENRILRTRYALAEMADFQPRYADQTFTDTLTFWGSQRNAKLRSMGRGHSEEDVVLLLQQDGIAFIGDIGFFDSQPYLGFCDIDLYRQQLRFFQEADFQVLVPGHGPVGGKDDLTVQLAYMDVMEKLVGAVVQRDGSFEEALQIPLPEPFGRWLIGGMERFEINVRYLFARFGGELPGEE